MKHPQSFCIVPWVHSHVQADGTRKPCCFYQGEASEVMPLEEYWNGEQMRDLRDAFNRGETPSGCEGCAARVDFNQKFSKEFPVENSINAWELPISIDYRLGNSCNFSCRMCDSNLSSSIENLEKKAGVYYGVEHSKEILEANKLELIKLIDDNKINHLYFADGEPLISPTFKTIVNKLISEGKAGDYTFSFNTNLSLLSEKRIEEFKAFKKTSIQISLDGVGEIGEFIRTGLDFKGFDKKLDELIKKTSFELSITATLTIPTLLGLVDLIKYAQKKGLAIEFSYPLPHGRSALFMPHLIPENELKEIIQDTLEEGEFLQSEYRRVLKDALGLIELNSHKLIESIELFELWKGFKSIDVFREGMTTQNWFLSRPELKTYVDSILRHDESQKIFGQSQRMHTHLLSGEYKLHHPIKYHDDLSINLLFPFKDERDLEFFQRDLKMNPLNRVDICVIESNDTPFARLLQLVNRKEQRIGADRVREHFHQMGFKLINVVDTTIDEKVFSLSILNRLLSLGTKLFPSLFHLHRKTSYSRTLSQ